ncbi:MAG: hypothetical protein AYK19_16400 [Theionarchaea archaeon DG-70-1]|nr:MAG: hypothetical protein AYK19_16400 [Theionarchaea archaeon DG-70-1]
MKKCLPLILIVMCGCLGTSSWNTVKTEHYVFHYRPGSLAEKEIDYIAELQELSYTKIVGIMDVEFDEPIHYYLYSSRWDILYSTGDRGAGLANPLTHEVHALYMEGWKAVGPHEDTHVIAYWSLGNPPPFLQEGLAVFMMGTWWGRPLHEWGREFLEEEKLIPVKPLLISVSFQKYDTRITYPQSGSFTKYVIDVYGIEKFKEVYSQAHDENIKVLFEDVYGKSIDELEEEWITYLKSMG